MSTIIGDMEIRLRADIARLQRDMDDARRVTGNAFDRIGRAAGQVKAAIGSMVAGLTAAAFATWIKGAIDAGDAASKMSAKTGVAVKDIAGMDLSFRLGGLSGDAMSSSMGRLSKGIVEGSKGLEQLGVKTKGADGSLRGTREVLWEVADRFQGMDNGARKTAMAMELFGKSGADLIPMLNGGSEAMKEMDDMAQKLGLSISEEAAANSEKFNDTLDLLMMGSQGVARGLASELLPTLTSVSGAFLASMTEGDKLAKTAQFIGTGFKLLYSVGAGVVEVFSTVGKVVGGLMAYITNVLGTYSNVIGKIIDRDWRGAYDAIGNGVQATGVIIMGVGEDVAAGWKDTASTITTAWSGSGNAAVETMVKIGKMKTVIGSDSAAIAKAEADAKKKSEAAEKDRMKALEDGYKMQKDWMESLAAIDSLKYGAVDQEIENARKEADANESLVATFGMSKIAIEQLALARIEEQLAQAHSIGLTEQETEKLRALAGEKRRNVAAVGKLEGLQESTDVTRAKELLDILTQVDEVTKSAASNMAASFGRVGAAIGGLTTALSGYGRAQAAIAAQMAAAKSDPKNSPEKLAKLEIAAATASAQARIRSYGDMAGAAKGFFDENSSGYRTLENAEKAFRAFEMAMTLKSMALSLFASSTKATGAVAGQAVETSAVAAGEGARNLLKIPGVIMSFMSAMGPWGAAAAAVAIAAVLGGASKNSGGGGVSSESRQKSQGTGSVLGNSSAKSESISKSLQIMERNSGLGLAQGNMMVTYLRAMATGISGMASLVVRTAGVTGGYQADQMGGLTTYVQKNLFSKFDPLLGGFINKIGGKVGNAIFGGKKSVTDTGFAMEKDTLGGMLANGVKAYQYTDVKKDGGAFHSNKYSTDWKDLPAEANAQFGKIIASMASLLTEAGDVLGIGGDAFTAKLRTFVIDINKMSFKDMTGDEVQKAIENIFSTLGDDMARFAIEGLDKFTKVGEGYLETVARVVNDLIQVREVFAVLGKPFSLTGTAAITASESLIEAAGGLEKLTGGTQFFVDNFMTEAERLAPVAKFLSVEMNKLGLAGVVTRDQFKDVVLGLDLTSDAGQKQYVAMMELEGAFAKVHAQTKDLTKSQQEIADERASLQDRMDSLTMTSAQLRAKERATLDASNRTLFDQINAREDLAEAYDRESNAVKSLVDGMKSAQSSTLAYKDSLALGSLSILTPLQKAAEAQRQYDDSLAKVRANPADAQAYTASQAAASAFLAASQVVNASGAAQVAAVKRVESDMAALAGLAGAQVTDAQLQLSVMEKQYGELVALNQSVLSFKDALINLGLVQEAASSSVPQIDFAAMGTSNMISLVTEIKGLRSSNEALIVEVTALRADQVRHTAALMDSNARVTTDAADQVIEGNLNASRDATWTSAVKRILE